MRKVLRWVTQFSGSMLLFWWLVAAFGMGSCAFYITLLKHGGY